MEKLSRSREREEIKVQNMVCINPHQETKEKREGSNKEKYGPTASYRAGPGRIFQKLPPSK